MDSGTGEVRAELAKAEADLRARLARKEIVIGFGHPVYTVSDPRNAINKAWSKRLAAGHPREVFYAISERIEQIMADDARSRHAMALRQRMDGGLQRHLEGSAGSVFLADDDGGGLGRGSVGRSNLGHRQLPCGIIQIVTWRTGAVLGKR
jgi:hypothetical protein